MMERKPVLIVDDEKNIRMTVSQALVFLEVDTDTAMNGEEAISKLKEKRFGVILLDLRMPGMDGMEVLRQVREIQPDARVIIITAYGTIESAVEAMKLGAVDFIQKPFTPEEIRELVSQVVDREKLDARKASDYASHIAVAKKCVGDGNFDAAIEHIREAISYDPSRPEAINFYGALLEIKGNYPEAQKQYRAALALDPTYKPAAENLSRLSGWQRKGGIRFGDMEEGERQQS